ncbi:hypothetical protein [Acetobacter senegalensis]|uniref:hypothetical protein n=1 Tax=Acetobacter senegalensis TaxID=446692 RepID=UPI001EDB6343|nr:hypothetical protein [Acetobacter senegalensis]MCG4256956.1 hypothetical protein [Acetobacter senegalensis]MCG4266906.1 hypothetical protein [Acetobacter senegalensis]
MIRSVSLLMILLLSACSTVPTRARHDLIGLPRAELIACAGVPDNRELLPDGEVLEWRQDAQVEGPLNIKTPFSLELDIGGRGTCHLVARLQAGQVAQIEYTGPSATLTGPYAACRPLVLACERRITHK